MADQCGCYRRVIVRWEDFWQRLRQTLFRVSSCRSRCLIVVVFGVRVLQDGFAAGM